MVQFLEAIRQSEELKKVFLPILRADVELLEKYKNIRSEPLDCPISVLGGESDPAISKAMLAGWQILRVHYLFSMNFLVDISFINSERNLVIETILNDLVGKD